MYITETAYRSGLDYLRYLFSTLHKALTPLPPYLIPQSKGPLATLSIYRTPDTRYRGLFQTWKQTKPLLADHASCSRVSGLESQSLGRLHISMWSRYA